VPTIPFRIAAVSQQLDHGFSLSEPLLFPEISRLDADSARSRTRLRRRVAKWLKDASPEDLSQRRLGDALRVEAVRVRIDPPKQSVTWQEPVRLQFEYVAWSHGDEAAVAYVPALGIEVISEKVSSLKSQVALETRAALTRHGVSTSLRSLAEIDTRSDLAIHRTTITVDLPTPKQLAQRNLDEDGDSAVLPQVATDLNKEVLPVIHERDDLVDRLAEKLAGHPRSILLVGDSGVGKTALVHEVVRRRRNLRLGRRRFWSTSGARLVAGMSGFGMWQERCQQIIREARETLAIVHLGNLVELLEVGKSISQNQGIASFLRPALHRGELQVIAECTPEQLAVIEKQDPQLLAVFEQLTIAAPSDEELRSILLAAALSPPPIVTRTRSGRPRVVRRAGAPSENPIEPEAIETLDRLHRQYATYSASPGRPLRFLQNLLEDRAADHTLTAIDVTNAFSRETGLPRFMLDDDEPLDLEQAHSTFAQRVLGQPQPVRLLTDLLATIKAGLSRPGQPIASLLFVGPTGVGKTELAKALAEFLYQDAQRLVRIDMSEYADVTAVDRLIGNSLSSRGLLTRKIREQPFTVVLLDEFEKAHARLFDLLLQVLGEGRLTDGGGRVADFRNAVVILTSNLGADGFRGMKFGFADANLARDAQDYFTQQAREFLRPELFNRIDRVVPFLPLDHETIRGIAHRELEKIRGRDGVRYRGVTLEIDDSALGVLATDGYHPRYGARPLKRQLEQRLVAPLAEQANEYGGDTELDAKVYAAGERIAVKVRAREKAKATLDQTQRMLRGIESLSQLRRLAQRLESSPTMLRIRNEAYRLKQQIAHLNKHADQRAYRILSMEQRLQQLTDLSQRAEKLLREASEVEDQELLVFYKDQPPDLEVQRLAIGDIDQTLNKLMLDIHSLETGRQSRVAVAIFGERHEHVVRLARCYESLAAGRGWFRQRYHLKMYRVDLDPEVNKRVRGSELQPAMRLTNRQAHEAQPSEKVVDAFSVNAVDAWYDLPSDAIGMALQVQGDLGFSLLEPEFGVHEFKTKTAVEHCLVETHGDLLIKYNPPAGIGRRMSYRELPVRRMYDMVEQIAVDIRLAANLDWSGRVFDDVVAGALEEYLTQRIRSVIVD
jgi:ATP-dependent Clp protease ATP-binding subunit ClpA